MLGRCREWRKRHGPKPRVTRIYRSTDATLTPEQEAELWAHFDASFEEMNKAFNILRKAS